MGWLKRIFGGSGSRSLVGKGKNVLPHDWWKAEGVMPLATGGAYDFEVRGELAYQDALADAVGAYYDDGVYWQVLAQLAFDDANPHDANAVAVTVNCQVVGYVPKSEARAIRAEMLAINPGRMGVVCRGEICGGYLKRNGDRANYGIYLNLRRPLEPRVRKIKSSD